MRDRGALSPLPLPPCAASTARGEAYILLYRPIYYYNNDNDNDNNNKHCLCERCTRRACVAMQQARARYREEEGRAPIREKRRTDGQTDRRTGGWMNRYPAHPPSTSPAHSLYAIIYIYIYIYNISHKNIIYNIISMYTLYYYIIYIIYYINIIYIYNQLDPANIDALCNYALLLRDCLNQPDTAAPTITIIR